LQAGKKRRGRKGEGGDAPHEPSEPNPSSAITAPRTEVIKEGHTRGEGGTGRRTAVHSFQSLLSFSYSHHNIHALQEGSPGRGERNRGGRFRCVRLYQPAAKSRGARGRGQYTGGRNSVTPSGSRWRQKKTGKKEGKGGGDSGPLLPANSRAQGRKSGRRRGGTPGTCFITNPRGCLLSAGSNPWKKGGEKEQVLECPPPPILFPRQRGESKKGGGEGGGRREKKRQRRSQVLSSSIFFFSAAQAKKIMTEKEGEGKKEMARSSRRPLPNS